MKLVNFELFIKEEDFQKYKQKISQLYLWNKFIIEKYFLILAFNYYGENNTNII
jgi:hypothetical protein